MGLAMRLRVRMLGGFEVCRDPGGPVEIPARKARALLALLARHPGQPLGREALAARLWPDASERNARTSLRQTLKQLRRLLGGGDAQAILSEGDALVLDPACAEVDAVAFERLCGEGSLAALEQAAALYRGGFLDGFVVPVDEMEEWLTFERSALRELAVGALTRLAEGHSEAGRAEPAVRAALRLLALDPFQEHVHRLLMRLYLDQGRRGDAAAQYRLCRDTLMRDLGVAPEPETERLYRSLHEAAEAAPGGAISDKPAVAVLPFRNLGEDLAQDYFSDGLTEDIIAALTRWRSFPVIARHSSFAFRGKRFEIGDAGRELGARYLLEGSVRRHRRRVRISVQLSDCETGVHLWAERYDRELVDIFEVQDDITRRIAATVAPELLRAELQRSAGKRPEDLDAWDCFLRGMAKIHERTPEGNLEARALFVQAIAIRPDYADAHAGVAMSYNINILLDAVTDREAAAREAMAAARRAVELDPGSAVAHQELSTAYQWLDRTGEALAEVRIAVELNPCDAVGLHQLGNKSDLAGDPRGIGTMEQAYRLNPLDMQLHTRLAFLARAYLNAGVYGDAVERARGAIRRQAHYAPSHYILALALGGLGRIDEGRAALARCEALQPGFVAERRDWAPYWDQASNARLRQALERLERD